MHWRTRSRFLTPELRGTGSKVKIAESACFHTLINLAMLEGDSEDHQFPEEDHKNVFLYVQVRLLGLYGGGVLKIRTYLKPGGFEATGLLRQRRAPRRASCFVAWCVSVGRAEARSAAGRPSDSPRQRDSYQEEAAGAEPQPWPVGFKQSKTKRGDVANFWLHRCSRLVQASVAHLIPNVDFLHQLLKRLSSHFQVQAVVLWRGLKMLISVRITVKVSSK